MLYRISSAWLSLRMRFLKMPFPIYFQVRVDQRRDWCDIWKVEMKQKPILLRRSSWSDTDRQVRDGPWPQLLLFRSASSLSSDS